ncbi:chromatin assembly factor 1 subunit B, partial [Clarias magur]
NAYDPDVSAKQFWIDKTKIKDQDCLIFMDNGKGMNYDKMHKMMNFGFSNKQPENQTESHEPVGQYGNGFKSGSMRLGKDALVFSKKDDIMCVGLLSQTYLKKKQKYSGELEFDVINNRYDIRVPVDDDDDYDDDDDDVDVKCDGTRKKLKRNAKGSISVPESKYSLRAYCSILYLNPRMQIILQGQEVKTQPFSETLANVSWDRYKPVCDPPLKTELTVTFGFNKKNKEHCGLMMYHKNRLIKAYARVACQRRATDNKAMGVIGVIECNHLKTTHNKQDFVYSEEYRKQPMRVQCNDCLKWRKLPDGIDPEKLPNKWLCNMNSDPKFRSCQAEEEPEDPVEEPRNQKEKKPQFRNSKQQKKVQHGEKIKVQKQHPDNTYIMCSKCQLSPGKKYRLQCEPCESQPKIETFNCDYGSYYHPTFEVILNTEDEDFRLTLLNEFNQMVWETLQDFPTDNAYDPDVSAKQFWISKTKIQDQHCLLFMDNGKGMDYDKMHKMLRTSLEELEFDFEKDRYDFQIPTEVYENIKETNRQQAKTAVQVPEIGYSLRAYCSILYLKPKMQIIIQGQKVETQYVTKTLEHVFKDTYKPVCNPPLKKPIPITFGYNTKSREHYGIMMYHKNRLIRAYDRVGCQRRINGTGVGVIGVIECNYLTPTHNKQDFDNTDEYRRTMLSLGTKLEDYWKEIRYRHKKNNSTESIDDFLTHKPDQTWVQCDDCLKWRKLPDGVGKLPKKWFCKMNADNRFRSCAAEEEPEDSDDEQRGYQKTYKQDEKYQKIQEEKKNSEQNPSSPNSSCQSSSSSDINSSSHTGTGSEPPDNNSVDNQNTPFPPTPTKVKRALDQNQESPAKKKARGKNVGTGPDSSSITRAFAEAYFAPSVFLTDGGNESQFKEFEIAQMEEGDNDIEKSTAKKGQSNEVTSIITEDEQTYKVQYLKAMEEVKQLQNEVGSLNAEKCTLLTSCESLQKDLEEIKNEIEKMWRVDMGPDGKAVVEFLSNLARHTKAVNVVRFCPTTELLASGGDDAAILLWKINDNKEVEQAPTFQEEEDALLNKESWNVVKTLRGHIEDVYDLSWTSDGNFLVSGSVDNTAIMWDIQKGQKICIFNDHKSYVQGVSWDPLGQYISTLSCDRVMRVYSTHTKKKAYSVSKMTSGSAAEGEVKNFRMFHDDSMRSFFRRLTFTPDGSFLLAPAGCVETGENVTNTTYVFSRKSFKRPIAHLPCPAKATLAVRCCPVFFELRTKKLEDGTVQPLPNAFQLPYRLVFAVASEDSIFFYDTQQTVPFGYVSNIHYHTLSDLSWSRDGSFLAVSSTDGYCSFVSFDELELGTPLKERPQLDIITPLTASEKKGKRTSGSGRTASPVPRTNPSPVTQEKETTATPEEKRTPQGLKTKSQPRRITLNTLEGWSKPSTPKSPATPTAPPSSSQSTPKSAPSTPLASRGPLTPKTTQSTSSTPLAPISARNSTTPKGPTPRRISLTSLTPKAPASLQTFVAPSSTEKAKH